MAIFGAVAWCWETAEPWLRDQVFWVAFATFFVQGLWLWFRNRKGGFGVMAGYCAVYLLMEVLWFIVPVVIRSGLFFFLVVVGFSFKAWLWHVGTKKGDAGQIGG